MNNTKNIYVHWKSDIRSPFVPEKNGLICDLFFYAIHKVDTLHALVLGKSILISDLFLYPVFLYPVSSVVASLLRENMSISWQASLVGRSLNQIQELNAV